MHVFFFRSAILGGDLRSTKRSADIPGMKIRWRNDNYSRPGERYKIRSISLSVLNTTETNLDTSLFRVICSLPRAHTSLVRPLGIAVHPAFFSSRAGPAPDKAPAFSRPTKERALRNPRFVDKTTAWLHSSPYRFSSSPSPPFSLFALFLSFLSQPPPRRKDN